MVAVRRGSAAGLAIVGTIAMGWAACGDSETTGPALDPPLEGGLDVVLERDEFRPDSTYPDVDSATPDADADADAKVWPDARPDGSEEYDWLFDPEAWIPVPEITVTNVAVADVSKLQWPGFVWEDCGVGCRMSKFDPGPLEVTSISNGSSVRLIDGEWVGSFTLSYPFPNFKRAKIVVRVNVDTGQVWGAVRLLRTEPQADMWMMFADATRVFSILPIDDNHKYHIVGLLPQHAGGFPVWLEPNFPLGPTRRAFDFDTSWHWGAVVDHHAVKVATQPGSTELQLVHSGSYIQEMAVAGSSLYWVDCENPTARLWGWTLGGQAKVLASGPWHASMVAASEDRIAWIGAQGSDYCSGGYESADLYWSARTDNVQALDVQGPIDIPISYKATLAVSTVWAATSKYTLFNENGSSIILVRLSDGKLWEIPGRGASFYNVVLSLRDDELLTIEESTAKSEMRWLVRYDLTKLDQYATPLP